MLASIMVVSPLAASSSLTLLKNEQVAPGAVAPASRNAARRVGSVFTIMV
jgi:hypothetical protein